MQREPGSMFDGGLSDLAAWLGALMQGQYEMPNDPWNEILLCEAAVFEAISLLEAVGFIAPELPRAFVDPSTFLDNAWMFLDTARVFARPIEAEAFYATAAPHH